MKVKSIYRVSESEQIDYISHIYIERERGQERDGESGIWDWVLDPGSWILSPGSLIPDT